MIKILTILFGGGIGSILILIGLALAGVVGVSVDGNTDGDSSVILGIVVIVVGAVFIIAPFYNLKKK